MRLKELSKCQSSGERNERNFVFVFRRKGREKKGASVQSPERCLGHIARL